MTARYISPNCTAGACSACALVTACAHPCHVDGSARAVIVPDPVVHAPNPAYEALVEERASAACLAAEPHDDGPCFLVAPCVRHLSDARVATFEQWLAQQRAEVA